MHKERGSSRLFRAANHKTHATHSSSICMWGMFSLADQPSLFLDTKSHMTDLLMRVESSLSLLLFLVFGCTDMHGWAPALCDNKGPRTNSNHRLSHRSGSALSTRGWGVQERLAVVCAVHVCCGDVVGMWVGTICWLQLSFEVRYEALRYECFVVADFKGLPIECSLSIDSWRCAFVRYFTHVNGRSMRRHVRGSKGVKRPQYRFPRV